MKKGDFKDLVKSIDQAGRISALKIKAGRVTKFPKGKVESKYDSEEFSPSLLRRIMRAKREIAAGKTISLEELLKRIAIRQDNK